MQRVLQVFMGKGIWSLLVVLSSLGVAEGLATGYIYTEGKAGELSLVKDTEQRHSLYPIGMRARETT